MPRIKCLPLSISLHNMLIASFLLSDTSIRSLRSWGHKVVIFKVVESDNSLISWIGLHRRQLSGRAQCSLRQSCPHKRTMMVRTPVQTGFTQTAMLWESLLWEYAAFLVTCFSVLFYSYNVWVAGRPQSLCDLSTFNLVEGNAQYKHLKLFTNCIVADNQFVIVRRPTIMTQT